MISRETEAIVTAVESRLETWEPRISSLSPEEIRLISVDPHAIVRPVAGLPVSLGQRILARLKRFTQRLR